MSQQTINNGESGGSVRSKINSNFTELYGSAPPFSLKGQIINEQFASSFSNYTASGTATWSIVGGTLQGAGGTTMVLTDYVRHSGWGSTAIRNFHAVTEIIVGTIGANSHGVWIGFVGQGVASSNSVNFALRLNTARQGFLEAYINNTTGLVSGVDFSHLSTTALTVSTGDRIRLILDVVENEYIFKAVNLTQTSAQPVVLAVTTSPVVGTQWANYNTGQFALGVCGGTHQFDFHTVNVNDVIVPDILIAGDSISTGAGVINVEQSFPMQLEKLTGLKIMRWSGGGNRVQDLKGLDIAKYSPKNVVIFIGVNDATGGRTSGQLITDINQVLTDLGGGYVVGTNVFICEVLPYSGAVATIQTYNTALQTNYSTGLIRWYKTFNDGTGSAQPQLVNADGLHPNWLGHKLLADFLYQDLRERGIVSPAIKPKSNQSQVWSYDGKIGIGVPNPFTPKLPLQVVSPTTQISFGNDATNPNNGGSLVSTTATSAFLSAGMYFDGSNNISTGTAGQTQVFLQDGGITFRSQTGIAAGSTVSSVNTFFRMTSGGNFGINMGANSPGQRFQVVDESASTTRGILTDFHANDVNGALVAFRKSRGSLASPTASSNSDYAFNIYSDNHSGTSYLRTVHLGGRVNGTVTTSSVPTDFFIATSATGTTDPYTDNTVRLVVSSTGSVGVGTTSPNSLLHINGSVSTAYVAKTGSYTLTISDHTIEVTSGTNTQTLPTAVGISGRIYVVTNSGSGVVTVATTSSQTFVNVSGTPTSLTLNQFGCATIQSNGANWLLVALR